MGTLDGRDQASGFESSAHQIIGHVKTSEKISLQQPFPFRHKLRSALRRLSRDNERRFVIPLVAESDLSGVENARVTYGLCQVPAKCGPKPQKYLSLRYNL
jgi:hypothetical protein